MQNVRGELNISENASTAECEYCGSLQTIPTVQDENLQGLFNRANLLRRKSEFDKAEKIYEKIVQVDSTQSEAYWGLILCKYGIEYVEDPNTFKRIPTCHRTSLDSIVTDEDYLSALANADILQRRIYEAEAREIDRLQKEIITLFHKEDPYDVFICYKESDGNNKRTQDSVIANDIYHQLTQEGFKVFFSAITLEDRLGSAYEPCIFAALSSARVMLAIGTKPEYFNAVWVKNEWSRFLKMMKTDRSKLLIPCYKDMDAYELPEEFSHLQAQDMGKIGFINDVIRGIKKLIKKGDSSPLNSEAIIPASTTSNPAPLLKRAKLFLEDRDWESADEYAEKVLDQDPECAEAYVVKLCAELALTDQQELSRQHTDLMQYSSFQKALRFANEGYHTTLTQYMLTVKGTVEEDRKASIYNKALTLFHSEDADDVLQAKEKLLSISDYKDASILANQCDERAQQCRKEAIYTNAVRLASQNNSLDSQRAALKLFETIPNWKNSAEAANRCRQTIQQLEAEAEFSRKQVIYDCAYRKYQKCTIHTLRAAIEEFESIPGFKDADNLAKICRDKLLKLEEAARQKQIQDKQAAEHKRMLQQQINAYQQQYPQLKSIEENNATIKRLTQKIDSLYEKQKTTHSLIGLYIWGILQGLLGLACISFAPTVGFLNLIIGVVLLIIAFKADVRRSIHAQLRAAQSEQNRLQHQNQVLMGQVPPFEEFIKTYK